MTPEKHPGTPTARPGPAAISLAALLQDPRLPLVVVWGLISSVLIGWALHGNQAVAEATAFLIVHEAAPRLYEEGSGEESGAFRRFQQTEAALVTTHEVLNIALAEHPELVEYPLLARARDDELALREAIRVRVPPGSNLIEVSISSQDPAEAEVLVEAVVNAAVEAAQDRSSFEAAEMIGELVDDANTLELRTAVGRAELRTLVADLGASDPEALEGWSQATLERLRETIAARDQARRERIRLETAIRAAQIQASRSEGPSSSIRRVARLNLPWDRETDFVQASPGHPPDLEPRLAEARDREARLEDLLEQRRGEREAAGDRALDLAYARTELEADEANLRRLHDAINRIDLESRTLGRLARTEKRTQVVLLDPDSGRMPVAFAVSTGLGALMYLAFWLGERTGRISQAPTSEDSAAPESSA